MTDKYRRGLSVPALKGYYCSPLKGAKLFASVCVDNGWVNKSARAEGSALIRDLLWVNGGNFQIRRIFGIKIGLTASGVPAGSLSYGGKL
jgi:hypothetical protein